MKIIGHYQTFFYDKEHVYICMYMYVYIKKIYVL